MNSRGRHQIRIIALPREEVVHRQRQPGAPGSVKNTWCSADYMLAVDRKSLL